MQAALRAALERELGSRITGASHISGGDINHAFRVELDDRRKLFVKTNEHALPGMFGCEARGLAWLAEVESIRIPRFYAARDAGGDAAFLALELIEPGPRARDFDERLGRGLALIHRAGAPGFGFEQDNYIASLPQANPSYADWPHFYLEQRLLPLSRRALERGVVRPALHARFERLGARIDQYCGPSEAPARLHGDLWGGNAIADERGQPVLIDPAVYGGHREIDLAMMQLFGGFGAACFAAYDEAYPRADGYAERVGFYQLYPLLVHVNLFGASYLSGLERALSGLE